MTYTSLQSPANKDYQFELNVAHLYGNLMNTYGDNGNILMMKYVGEKLGAKMTFDIVSLGDDFDADYYDMVFFGGGQDYEQSIVAKDLPGKKEAIADFINKDKVILAICGGFQLLGQYYVQANGEKLMALVLWDTTLLVKITTASSEISKFTTTNSMKHTMALKITKGVPSCLKMKNL
ncbi:Putative amidotransferase [Streptococcus sp. HSISB1]|nr:Putative amidotransferase [Streptococcus sp. HSISB1]